MNREGMLETLLEIVQSSGIQGDTEQELLNFISDLSIEHSNVSMNRSMDEVEEVMNDFMEFTSLMRSTEKECEQEGLERNIPDSEFISALSFAQVYLEMKKGCLKELDPSLLKPRNDKA